MNLRAWSRVLSFLLIVGLAFWFTLENAGERVLVDFILFRMWLSLPVVVFLSVLAGMLVIFLVGLQADLRTRRTLERYRRAVKVDAEAEPTGGPRPARAPGWWDEPPTASGSGGRVVPEPTPELGEEDRAAGT